MPKGRVIDLDVPDVEAWLTTDGQPRVVLRILGGRRLFDTGITDRNTYTRGKIRHNKLHRGSVRSQEVGLDLAELPGVNKIQFRYQSGVFINIAVDDQHLVAHLKRVAKRLLDHAHAFDMQQRSIHPNP